MVILKFQLTDSRSINDLKSLTRIFVIGQKMTGYEPYPVVRNKLMEPSSRTVSENRVRIQEWSVTRPETKFGTGARISLPESSGRSRIRPVSAVRLWPGTEISTDNNIFYFFHQLTVFFIFITIRRWVCPMPHSWAINASIWSVTSYLSLAVLFCIMNLCQLFTRS